MKYPNFFIIGAPKCGTTSLAAWLGEHTKVLMSTNKEPYYFDTDNELGCVKTFEKYLRLFEGGKDQYLAIGEASVTYLSSQVAVRNILEFNPSAKFIVMLRNPLEMVVSLHNQMLWEGWECVDDFEEAWRIRNKREFGKDKVGTSCTDLKFLQYEEMCMLGKQVNQLLRVVNIKSVLFILLEDMKSDPSQEYCRAQSFLDVPDDGRRKFNIYNSSKRDKNWLTKLVRFYFKTAVMKLRLPELKRKLGIRISVMGLFNSIFTPKYSSPKLHPKIKQELIEVFSGDVLLLSKLIGRDLSHWMR